MALSCQTDSYTTFLPSGRQGEGFRLPTSLGTVAVKLA